MLQNSPVSLIKASFMVQLNLPCLENGMDQTSVLVIRAFKPLLSLLIPTQHIYPYPFAWTKLHLQKYKR
jgi:hypothetical protein